MKNLPFSNIRLLFLGSGELGKELVIESQRLGCEVITVDKYNNAPAMQVSDRNFVLDMSNKELLKDLLANLNPKVLRFTGEKFPSELWSTSSVKNEKNIASK